MLANELEINKVNQAAALGAVMQNKSNKNQKFYLNSRNQWSEANRYLRDQTKKKQYYMKKDAVEDRYAAATANCRTLAGVRSKLIYFCT